MDIKPGRRKILYIFIVKSYTKYRKKEKKKRNDNRTQKVTQTEQQIDYK